jgi:hypothetical protein
MTCGGFDRTGKKQDLPPLSSIPDSVKLRENQRKSKKICDLMRFSNSGMYNKSMKCKYLIVFAK